MAAAPFWDTASEGDQADTSTRDLEALGEHTSHCSEADGRWIAVQCGLRHLLGFVSAHRVTTGAVLAAVAGALLMWR